MLLPSDWFCVSFIWNDLLTLMNYRRFSLVECIVYFCHTVMIKKLRLVTSCSSIFTQTSGPWKSLLSVCLCLCCPGAGDWAVWRCGSVRGHHYFSPGHRCSVGSRVPRSRVKKHTRQMSQVLQSSPFVLISWLTSLCVNAVNAYQTNVLFWSKHYDIYGLEFFV